MTSRILLAGAIPASFLAACSLGGLRVALAPPDSGSAAAAGAQGGAGDSEFKALAQGLKTATDEVKRFAEKAEGEMKSLGKLTEETKAGADKAITEMNGKISEFDTRLADVEQKAARRGGGHTIEAKSLGQHFIDSERAKTMLADGSAHKGSARVTIETKNITSAASTVGAGVSAGNSLVPADRQPIVGLPNRTLRVRDLITPGQTSSSNIEYPAETGFTNAAAPVAEGNLKPKSDITFDLRSAPVRTIAHYFKASRQILDDAVGLASYIDGRARYGLEFVEEAQILYGNGTGANLNGIMPQASAYAAPAGVVVASETPIDRLRLAILQATLALYPASGIVLNDTDWARIELTKDSQGRYIIGSPQGQIAPTLWGLPVATTLAMAANDFLVGAFRLGAQLFDRMAIEVLVSSENEDDFIRNLLTIRAEERLALAVYRPAAFVKGNLVNPG
ncbi:phage major capsid protein [Methylorubrum populi]